MIGQYGPADLSDDRYAYLDEAAEYIALTLTSDRVDELLARA